MLEPADDKTLPGPNDGARRATLADATVDLAPAGVVVGGRYVVHERIASSGMAAIHLGTSTGAEGFTRLVAVKRLLPEHCTDPEMVAMFIDEARIGAAVRHANVVATLDLVREHTDVFLVMEYVEGASLLALLRSAQQRRERVPRGIAVAIIVDVLRGLHAAHTAVDAYGERLEVVHRDISPSNVLVGADGTTRVIDFGIATARGRLHETRGHGKDDEANGVKGKLVYLAPEQITGERADARTDVYAAGVVLWELVTGQRLFHGESDLAIATKILAGDIAMPSTLHSALAPFDDVVRHAVARDRHDRFPNALEMARAVERCGVAASRDDVAAWLEYLMADPFDDALSTPAALSESGAREHLALTQAVRSMRISRRLEIVRGTSAAAAVRSAHSALRALVDRALATRAVRDHAEGLATEAASIAARFAERLRLFFETRVVPNVDASVVAVVVLMAVACVSVAAAMSAAPVR